jgi:hypothetical protein
MVATISHESHILLTPPSQDFPVMTAGPRYIALARTEQKTLHPTVIPLLLVAQPLLNNGYFSGSTVLALSKYATV